MNNSETYSLHSSSIATIAKGILIAFFVSIQFYGKAQIQLPDTAFRFNYYSLSVNPPDKNSIEKHIATTRNFPVRVEFTKNKGIQEVDLWKDDSTGTLITYFKIYKADPVIEDNENSVYNFQCIDNESHESLVMLVLPKTKGISKQLIAIKHSLMDVLVYKFSNK